MFADVRPFISRGRKKFHRKSSTHCTVHKMNFFHCRDSGSWDATACFAFSALTFRDTYSMWFCVLTCNLCQSNQHLLDNKLSSASIIINELVPQWMRLFHHSEVLTRGRNPLLENRDNRESNADAKPWEQQKSTRESCENPFISSFETQVLLRRNVVYSTTYMKRDRSTCVIEWSNTQPCVAQGIAVQKAASWETVSSIWQPCALAPHRATPDCRVQF